MNNSHTTDTGTIDALVDKLTTATLPDGVQDLVLAALEGEDALRSHLQSPDRAARTPPTAAAKSNSAVRPNEAYLSRSRSKGSAASAPPVPSTCNPATGSP